MRFAYLFAVVFAVVLATEPTNLLALASTYLLWRISQAPKEWAA